MYVSIYVCRVLVMMTAEEIRAILATHTRETDWQVTELVNNLTED